MSAAAKAEERAAKHAFAIEKRMIRACSAERSMWPHQAQAIIDMREGERSGTGGWTALGLDEFEDWLEKPEIAMSIGKAKKIAATLAAYQMAGFDDPNELGRHPWSKVYVTAAAVRAGLLTPEQALEQVAAMRKPELEREMRKLKANDGTDGDGDDLEPEEWTCPTCGATRTGTPPPMAVAA